MLKDDSGRLAPVPGYLTSQMLLMDDVAKSNELPFFDIIEYGELRLRASNRMDPGKFPILWRSCCSAVVVYRPRVLGKLVLA